MKEIYVRTKLVNGTYVYAPKGTKDTYGTVLIDNYTLKYDNNNKLKVDVSVINSEVNEELRNEIEIIKNKVENTTYSYIINFNYRTPFSDYYNEYKRPDGTKFNSSEEIDEYIGDRANDTGRFKLTTTQQHGFGYSETQKHFIVCYDGTDGFYIIYRVEDLCKNIKLGDIFYIYQYELPDYWVVGISNNANGSVGMFTVTAFESTAKKLNIENGTGTSSIQQKGITYDKLITDYEPNMAAWVIAKNGNAVPANVSVYLTTLQNSTVPTSEQVVDILNNRKNDVNTVITNFKTLPSPYDSYGIDSLIAGALAGYGLTPASDLSNIVGKVGSAAAILGAMNKAFSPGAFAGGVGCEAGDEGYPGDTVCSFAFGSNVKTKGICSVGIGRDLENLGDTSAIFGRGNKEYKIEGSDGNKVNQRRYLDNLAEAGGNVTGTGDDRVAVVGINKGTNNFMAGNSHYIGDRTDSNAVVGNQNIIGADNANSFISGLIDYIGLSNGCGIIGYFNKIVQSGTCGIIGMTNKIEHSSNTFLAGYHLSVSGGVSKTAVGLFNDDKANTRFEVGNGTSETDRKNAFEVLKDGRAKVYGEPTESNDILRLNEFSVLTQSQVDLLF